MGKSDLRSLAAAFYGRRQNEWSASKLAHLSPNIPSLGAKSHKHFAIEDKLD
jgi:hypothetical protein